LNNLYRSVFQKLSFNERQALLTGLNLPLGFLFKRFERFERFGQSTDTAVYEYEHSEFVFVPGDKVILGWKSFAVGMDTDMQEDMMETLQECGVDNLESFLQKTMSPVRTVTIGPMLVERELHDIGWRRVSLDSNEIVRDEYFEKAISKIRGKMCYEYTIKGALRLRANDGEITADIYEKISYDELVLNIKQSGFRLPTEDEWEYLCGGGLRTMFRWGDSFDYCLHLRHFEAATPEKKEYDLEKPNQFGLFIAYDPYKLEVVMDSEQFFKGGDGGCNICGGLGLTMGYLPVATYFRNPNMHDKKRYKAKISGDYTFYRRIIRL
jgi:hypothetical protein